MVIYLIGPSGAGKTTCATEAAQVLDIEHRELDVICKGRTNDWEYCQRALLHIEDGGREGSLILDIGAGTQNDCTRELEQYLTPRSKNVILITMPPGELHVRKNEGRSLEDFKHIEYDTRTELYAIPAQRLDVTGKSKDEAKEYFASYLGRVLGIALRT